METNMAEWDSHGTKVKFGAAKDSALIEKNSLILMACIEFSDS